MSKKNWWAVDLVQNTWPYILFCMINTQTHLKVGEHSQRKTDMSHKPYYKAISTTNQSRDCLDRLANQNEDWLVLWLARPQAMSQAKPGPNRLGQAGPISRPEFGFGPACCLKSQSQADRPQLQYTTQTRSTHVHLSCQNTFPISIHGLCPLCDVEDVDVAAKVADSVNYIMSIQHSLIFYLQVSSHSLTV